MQARDNGAMHIKWLFDRTDDLFDSTSQRGTFSARHVSFIPERNLFELKASFSNANFRIISNRNLGKIIKNLLIRAQTVVHA